MNVRKLALELLNKTEKAGQYSNIAIDNAIKKNCLDTQDSSLLCVLVYGVIERKLTLDYIINSLSSLPPSKIELNIRNILRMGLYQLIYLDKIPPHAAINESVELCPQRSRGFANAILRNYQRKSAEIVFPDKEKSPTEYLSVTYSFPTQLCEKFIEIFGFEKAEKIFDAFCKEPSTTLRVNTLKISTDDFVSKLVAKDINAERSSLSPCGVKVSGSPVSELGIDEGLCFVQDEASQLCVLALGAQSGDRVLDICSCPGSKSFGAAIEMKNVGEIRSFDLHENKLSLVNRGAENLGISIISTDARDGRIFDEALENYADKIICDVPCSGFGVMAKKPEIRYKDPKESEGLPQIQYDILCNSARYLKKGGVLVYSTCTLLPEENQLNVEKFLAAHKNFETCDFNIGGIASKDGMLTLNPYDHKTDGFFIAKLRKVK
ncbi:MAG: 16S rRNA (cytosine(967)-C(5))-methyltransferase RsmB [Clostridia bacterium]|nr:16S rRNA (cytosine(967)-C(5))-methyltransferase RsmB [Clostridia bacterium]